MTKFYLILFFSLLNLNTFCLTSADTIYYNNKWEQCDKSTAHYYRLISFDTTGKIQFNVKDFFLSGKIQMQGIYLSINPDIRTGNFTYWFENGFKQLECSYVNNLLTGYLYEWYDNGVLKSQRYFMNGVQQGTEKTWSNTGILQKAASYKKGAKNGKFITYYDNGKPIRKDIYKNDSLVKGKCYTSNGRDTSYFSYFIMPKFEGGIEGFKAFITERLNYPNKAKVNHEEGEVLVRFTIDRNGNLTRVSLVKEDKKYFNDEALRVLSLSPKWIPGKRDGKNIDVTITLPIRFRFNQ